MDKIDLVGLADTKLKEIVIDSFAIFGFSAEFKTVKEISNSIVVSLSKDASSKLLAEGIKFINWDLLFSVLGPNDSIDEIQQKLAERIRILRSVTSLKVPKSVFEFHGSIRVKDLAQSAAFYTWLFGVRPKEWTHRYVIFHRENQFNFVLLVSDGKELHHDTLYHLGIGLESKQKVIEYYHSAVDCGFHIEKKPRTTWRGTPLHELWLKDPDGTLIEVYSRLTDEELKLMPHDQESYELV